MNSKVAQEAAVRQIVYSVYDNYPDILELMMLVKKKKSIKTWFHSFLISVLHLFSPLLSYVA